MRGSHHARGWTRPDRRTSAALIAQTATGDPGTPITDRWDGTLGHIEHLARRAVAAHRASKHTEWGFEQRLDDAASAIGVAIAADPGASTADLIAAGMMGITDDRHLALAGRDTTGCWGPRARTFWLDRSDGPTYPAPRLDQLALTQIWARLDDTAKTTLVALAACDGSQRDAATALGITGAAVTRRVQKARRAAFDAWFDWESAPPIPRHTRARKTHCPQGHDLAVHGRERPGTRQRACRVCDRLTAQKKRNAA